MNDVHTPTMLEAGITALFAGTWIVLGIVSFVVFFLGKNTALKRKWFPRFMVLAGVLFVIFTTTFAVLGSKTWLSLGILVITVPAVALISYLNIKMTKFCDKCGATLINSNWFSPMRFCSKCGAALDDKSKGSGDNVKLVDDPLE
jgi:hypothetical protein